MSDDRNGDQPRASRIPEFGSIQEEAEFWDTHDTTDFEDEFHPIRVHFAPRLSDQGMADDALTHKLEVRFDEQTDQALAGAAREQGVKKSTLVRMLVKDWLREHDRHAS